MKNNVLCPCMDMRRHFHVAFDVHVLKLNFCNNIKDNIPLFTSITANNYHMLKNINKDIF